jgi:hypothetical protein
MNSVPVSVYSMGRSPPKSSLSRLLSLPQLIFSRPRHTRTHLTLSRSLYPQKPRSTCMATSSLSRLEAITLNLSNSYPSRCPPMAKRHIPTRSSKAPAQERHRLARRPPDLTRRLPLRGTRSTLFSYLWGVGSNQSHAQTHAHQVLQISEVIEDIRKPNPRRPPEGPTASRPPSHARAHPP